MRRAEASWALFPFPSLKEGMAPVQAVCTEIPTIGHTPNSPTYQIPEWEEPEGASKGIWSSLPTFQMRTLRPRKEKCFIRTEELNSHSRVHLLLLHWEDQRGVLEIMCAENLSASQLGKACVIHAACLSGSIPDR